MNDNQPAIPKEWSDRFSKYKEKLFEAAFLGIPIAVIGALIKLVGDKVLDQPWQAVLVLAPIAVIALLLFRRPDRRRVLTIDRRFLLFLGAYILFFVVAAQSGVLDWRRDPALTGPSGHRSWLIPVAWGDWRYRLVPKVPGDEMVVVLRKPPVSREAARVELARLAAFAERMEAKALVLDHYFIDSSQTDRLLCAVVAKLKIPVFVGYGFRRVQGHLSESPLPDGLKECFPTERRGHLMGYVDADKTARITPLHFNDDPKRPALGLRAARFLAGDAELALPANGRVRFIEPLVPHAIVRLDDLRADAEMRGLLIGRLVFVGEESPEDSFDTPFGHKPGVVVHADVAHSLLYGHYLQDFPWWLGLIVLVAVCYALSAWCADGAPVARMLLLCAGATIGLFAIAVVGVIVGPYWFEVVYPVTAIWLLLPLLLGLRRVVSPQRLD